ncbi:L,D-transpeptidase [Streptomyces rubiginosohelvolus]|uniref:L,D-transpeptidase n=1 Tax=Streptomyces rubiginosohelvolus TaxID=67362 RepID=UPI0036BD18F2
MRQTAAERGVQVARSSSGIVAGLTAAAVAGVAFLAYQASANAPGSVASSPGPKASATAPAKPSAKPKPADPLAVPASSGTGERVVYALKDRRVWLVNEDGKSIRTFTVMPSPISPPPGVHKVTSRSGTVQGSDGVPIEHVVRFANVNEVAIGFSAAQDGSMASPDPTSKTGGVRMKRADGNAMWTFATVGAKVVVVP